MAGQAIETINEVGDVASGLPAGYAAGNQSLAVSLARAEVDQQITTAHAYPRSVTRAVQNIMSLATIDDDSAEECIYALPRGGKPIKGPSVRLAEIIASQWGNCRVGARVVHVDRIEKYVEAEGVFHDLETNAATTARVRRRISDKHGKLLNDDMIVVTGNAACSIAKRNAILGAVPKAVWRKAYAAVEQVIAGDVKTLAERRDRAMKAFAAFGATPEQVFAALGIGGIDDLTLEHMTTLMGMHSALKSGEATAEEMFPKQPAPGEKPKNLAEGLDKLANAGKVDKKPTAHDADGVVIEDEQQSAAAASQAVPEKAEAGAKAPQRRASAAPAKTQPKESVTAAAAMDRGRADAQSGKERSEVPDDIMAAGREIVAAWFAGFDEIADAAVDEVVEAEDAAAEASFDFPGDR
ncbi:hypothetical protein OSH11_11920 [Kaistia dalseonensis]|uniref:Uncharacterized protein n=1 Tax=Kaistia dalseonensis TaxID=410840 RepID=A0ABU0H6R8_9HYPH|nr:hypothetical protein [Kaistia dalseonensis]MCX5495416.1 hypothetical protein [Kaistia dalseonensis]MDQ0438006.1 hypothetical protein [Kaistia dalseonensis]